TNNALPNARVWRSLSALNAHYIKLLIHQLAESVIQPVTTLNKRSSTRCSLRPSSKECVHKAINPILLKLLTPISNSFLINTKKFLSRRRLWIWNFIYTFCINVRRVRLIDFIGQFFDVAFPYFFVYRFGVLFSHKIKGVPKS